MILRILISLLLICPLTAQQDEVYFRLPETPGLTDRLTRICAVDQLREGFLYGYANDAEWRYLSDAYPAIERMPHPGALYEHAMSRSPMALRTTWDTYPTYDAYVDMMNQYALDYPAICRLDTFGTSTQGRLLLVIKISDNPAISEDEPEFLYTSTMHGDETVGFVLTLRLIDYLLSGYGGESSEGQRLTALINRTEILINPLFNPDGTYRGGNNTVTGAWRGNANGVDLNRNFPDRISDPNNTTQGRQSETAAMMRLVASRNITLSANFHTGARVVNYPWDNGSPSGTYSACPDDAWFIRLAKSYALPNPDITGGGFPNGITNGCQWYAIFGGRQDWIYLWHGGRETTIELWNTKNPPGSVLPERWERNRESLLVYMEQTHRGIRGIVRNAVTGEPVAAALHPAGTSAGPVVYSDSLIGNYHCLLLPGNYDLVARAEGFQSDTLFNIAVSDSGATRSNYYLQPLFTGVTDERHRDLPAQTPELLPNFPNPFNPATTLRFYLPQRSSAAIRVYSLTGRPVAMLWAGELAAGMHTVVWEGKNDAGQPVASGIYFYRLETPGNMLARRMLLLR